MRSNDILKAGIAALALLIAGLGTVHPVFSQEQAAAANSSASAEASDAQSP